jgi:hypothetical protein
MDGSVQVRRRCGYVIAPRVFPRERNGVEIGRRRKSRGCWVVYGVWGGGMEVIGCSGEEE